MMWILLLTLLSIGIIASITMLTIAIHHVLTIPEKPIIVISNHVRAIGMEYPEGALVRINLAWLSSVEEGAKIIDDVQPHKIYWDFPCGRKKPPIPIITFDEAIHACNLYKDRIEYFAFSNAESPEAVTDIRARIDPVVKLAPKIETLVGAKNLRQIIEAARTDLVMIDKEDGYFDCKGDQVLYDKWLQEIRSTCDLLNVQYLELDGVIFSSHGKPNDGRMKR